MSDTAATIGTADASLFAIDEKAPLKEIRSGLSVVRLAIFLAVLEARGDKL